LEEDPRRPAHQKGQKPPPASREEEDHPAKEPQEDPKGPGVADVEGQEDSQGPHEPQAHGGVVGVEEPLGGHPVPEGQVGGQEGLQVEDEEAVAQRPQAHRGQGHPRPHQAQNVEEAERSQRKGLLPHEEGGEEEGEAIKGQNSPGGLGKLPELGEEEGA